MKSRSFFPCFTMLLALSCTPEKETITSIDGLEISATQCQDGEDNDGDGFMDCRDQDCSGFVFCVDSGIPSGDVDTDNDSDSDADSYDDSNPDSDSDTGNSVLDDFEITATQCQDGEDNDNDGATDCKDEDCQGYLFCLDAGSPTDTDLDGGIEADAGTEECIAGQFVIENTLDLLLLQPFSCILGQIKIIDAGISSVALPNLEKVGSLVLYGTSVTDIDLSSLKSADELDFRFYTNQLKNIDLSSLITVSGKLLISYTKISSLDTLKNLVTAGEILIDKNDNLNYVDFSALKTVEWVGIFDNIALTHIDFRSLTTIENRLSIESNPVETLDLSSLERVENDFFLTGLAITSLNLGLLQTVGNIFEINLCNKIIGIVANALNFTSTSGYLSITRNSLLTNVSFDALTSVKNLSIKSNDSLNSLDGISSLKSVQLIDIRENLFLPQCEACEILNQIEGTAPSTILISGNKPDTCNDNCLE